MLLLWRSFLKINPNLNFSKRIKNKLKEFYCHAATALTPSTVASKNYDNEIIFFSNNANATSALRTATVASKNHDNG